MGNRNLIYILVAVGLGLVAVVLANSYFSGVEERQERAAQQQQMARIVVATQPLDFGSALTAENIRLQNFPSNSVPVGAFFSVEELLQGGNVALRPIVPGEPILADKLSGRAVLSAKLPDGMRAMSIPINAENAVSGFIRPADIVDVLLTRDLGEGDQVTEVIMEAVQVLAIGTVQSENATEPGLAGTATMLVDLYGAQKLTLARKMGEMSLVLRNVENKDQVAGVAVSSRDVSPLRVATGGGGGGGAAPAMAPPPVYLPAAAPASGGQAAAVPARPRGPSMTVIRGTATTDYSVDRLGGN